MNVELKPQNRGTKTLFQNPILEKLSRTHISVPLIIFFIYSTVLLYWSVTHTSISIGTTVLIFFIGVIFFSWVEYNVHRYVFHMPADTESRAKAQYTMHGVHHEFPKDKTRLAMPPILSITLATTLFFLFRLILGDFAYSFLPGMLVGYSGYLSVHYMVHAFQPPRNFFKILWINHGVHHYKNGDGVYGVSSPLWDYVYGTMSK